MKPSMLFGKKFLSALCTAVTMAVIGTSPAQSQTVGSNGGVSQQSQTSVSKEKGKLLPIEMIIATVKAQGYTDIEEIELEGDQWEICAKDSRGKEVDIEVNAATGKIEKVKEDG